MSQAARMKVVYIYFTSCEMVEWSIWCKWSNMQRSDTATKSKDTQSKSAQSENSQSKYTDTIFGIGPLRKFITDELHSRALQWARVPAS